MKRTLILTSLAVLVAVMTTAAMAQPGPGGCGHPMMGRGHGDGQMHQGKMAGHGRMERGLGVLTMADELGLTDQQIDKIKELSFAHQNTMIDMRAELKKAQLILREEMAADNPDKVSALAAARNVNAIEGKIEEARISHRFEMHDILTAEQLDKLKELRQDRPGRRGPDDRPDRERPRRGKG
jgi:Spy/CpxP family protein refolding chaperone